MREGDGEPDRLDENHDGAFDGFIYVLVSGEGLAPFAANRLRVQPKRKRMSWAVL